MSESWARQGQGCASCGADCVTGASGAQGRVAGVSNGGSLQVVPDGHQIMQLLASRCVLLQGPLQQVCAVHAGQAGCSISSFCCCLHQSR